MHDGDNEALFVPIIHQRIHFVKARSRQYTDGLREPVKVAIVTGGGGVIGSETARLLASEGAKVVVADVDADSAERAAQSVVDLGGVALAQVCDISDEDSVKRLVATAADRYGGLDHLFANAADTNVILRDSHVVDVPLDVIQRTIDVNLVGTLFCARHAIPEMLKRGSGTIVFTTSRAAHTGYPKCVYAMTKASLPALARHISSTWGKQGIRANCIAPGAIMTERGKKDVVGDLLETITKNKNVPRMGEPRDIAAAAAFFLSEDSGYINGQMLMVSGGQFY
jgi:NAD(P)-dependent dehydrogenase (short-subunit alcohol dehydrogenase family)